MERTDTRRRLARVAIGLGAVFFALWMLARVPREVAAQFLP